ncbi:MAG: penicillin acylase family protein [Acidobacteriota bacterium]|nr:penicillin acylase family protein [Acidobacteriota bacterium]
MRVDQYSWCLGCLVLALVATGCSAPASNTEEAFQAMAVASLAQIEGETELAGLRDEVEVLRDRWGVPHIYAHNTDDLFFAQGYIAAQDRLWQLDMWRRWLEGRTAEISGPERFEADRMMRLLSWRGGLSEEELGSYHPETERILEAFVGGINAFIEDSADNLPVEFKLTGLRPEPWTLETPTLRSTLSGVGGNIASDLRLAQRVASMGAEEANRRANPDPFYELVVPDGFDPEIITGEVLRAFSTRAGRGFAVDLLPEYRQLETVANGSPVVNRMLAGLQWLPPMPPGYRDEIGSNNWVVAGRLSASGLPMLANDPHRQVTNPSLRYLAHLEAPGWSVIGAGEPALPGIAIGHNEHVAWGLTIVGTDQTDVFVEQLHPDDPSRVLYRGQFEPLRVERETIAIKGESPREVNFEFSRNGPIIYKDIDRGVAYAVRSFAQEPGTAPYLGSLRADQVSDCIEFLDAMSAWKHPSENMICGDVDGNISWRAAALTPNRTGPTPWYGRLPVPGSGEYGWDGFRDDLPEELNPERGWIATANHNIQPPGFHPPIMFKTAQRAARYERIAEVLSTGGSSDGRFTIEDFQRLQLDAFSAAGANAVSLFEGWTSEDLDVEWARQQIAGWDGTFDRSSTAAALYLTWRGSVEGAILDEALPVEERRAAVEDGLRRTLDVMSELGSDRSQWRWGRLNIATFEHSLLAVYDQISVEKSGGAGTVYSNGATFREILDMDDWEKGISTTSPGQSGQPGSPHYGDLIESWAGGDYFPLAYARAAVEEVTVHRLVLKPLASVSR